MTPFLAKLIESQRKHLRTFTQVGQSENVIEKFNFKLWACLYQVLVQHSSDSQ